MLLRDVSTCTVDVKALQSEYSCRANTGIAVTDHCIESMLCPRLMCPPALALGPILHAHAVADHVNLIFATGVRITKYGCITKSAEKHYGSNY